MTAGPTPAGKWTDAFLDQMRTIGDPLADGVVAELFKSGGVYRVWEVMKTLVQNDHPAPEQLPAQMRDYLAATTQIPQVDDRLILGGQRLFERCGVEMLMVLACYSLPASYAARRGVQVLYRTGYLNNRPNHRLFETTQMVMDVLVPGGLADGRRRSHGAEDPAAARGHAAPASHGPRKGLERRARPAYQSGGSRRHPDGLHLHHHGRPGQIGDYRVRGRAARLPGSVESDLAHHGNSRGTDSRHHARRQGTLRHHPAPPGRAMPRGQGYERRAAPHDGARDAAGTLAEMASRADAPFSSPGRSRQLRSSP